MEIAEGVGERFDHEVFRQRGIAAQSGRGVPVQLGAEPRAERVYRLGFSRAEPL